VLRLGRRISAQTTAALQALGGDSQQHWIAAVVLHLSVVALSCGPLAEAVEQGVADQQLQPQPQRVGGAQPQLGLQGFTGLQRFTPGTAAIKTFDASEGPQLGPIPALKADL
jgi:hypothetical protein